MSMRRNEHREWSICWLFFLNYSQHPLIKPTCVIQCIKYEKLNDKLSTDIFTENILRGKLGINAIEPTKSLYDIVTK